MPKLIHYEKGTATIKLLTGMHIGGAKESIKIAGIDSPIIRNPITNMPFIPGSSLKGRFRMALELKYGDTIGGQPSTAAEHESYVCKLFGNAEARNSKEPTRLIFRDAALSSGFEEYATGEEKSEIRMDRLKMANASTGPRKQERIAAGAEFQFEVMIRVFENDDLQKMKDRIAEAINIVEAEYLGGSGTRGYGQVKFDDLKWEKVSI